jgi:predicted  nucleic acid-binding Zn-ribbon protein
MQGNAMKQHNPRFNRHSNKDHSNHNSIAPRIAHVEAAIDFMQRDISGIKSDIRDIRKDMNTLREELKTDIDSSRQDLKSEMASIRADFRILLSAILAATLSLGGLVAKNSGWF